MDFDNKIITFAGKKGSGLLTVKASEPSILIRTDVQGGAEIKLKKHGNNGAATANYKIGSAYQKIKIAPFASFEFEPADFRAYNRQFVFDVVQGTNIELIFFELSKTLFNYNSASSKTPFSFSIGDLHGNNVQVNKNWSGYNCMFHLNGELNFNKGCQVDTTHRLARLFGEIHEKIEKMKEMCPDNDTPSHMILARNKSFDVFMKKHFHPLC